MRINLFVASATGLSRRAADKSVLEGRVTINGHKALPGAQVSADDEVNLNAKRLMLPPKSQTILLNKPVGYICSRNGQGGKTIYDLLPSNLHKLKPIGRLDKDSSGLLLLTDDGRLANQLTHPSFQKQKIYEVVLDKTLSPADVRAIEAGIELTDGLSKLRLKSTNYHLPTTNYTVAMSEGRNRQIRRTFAALGYDVKQLHRTQFGNYKIGDITEGKYLLTK